MNDLLPLLALPLAYGWYLKSRRMHRELHGALASATAQHPGHVLLDAGPVPVLRVAASLHLQSADVSAPGTAPRRLSDHRLAAFADFLAPMGLALDPSSVPPARGRAAQEAATMRIRGERHGRSVEILLGPDRHEVRCGVRGPVAYRVQGSDGALSASPESPATLHTGLASLQPHRRWDHLALTGGADWLRLERRTAGAQSWVHDLWLAELVVDMVLLSTPHARALAERAPVDAQRPVLTGERGLPGQGQTAGA